MPRPALPTVPDSSVSRATAVAAPDSTAAPTPHVLRPDWHYHLLGIGGVGMSALAALLHERGVRVSGSDSQPGTVLDGLAGAGIPVAVGHTADSLAGADAVVYSSAVPATHPIWAEVSRRGLPRIHRAAMLGALAHGRRTLAIAGTHGKTTCTAALTHALAAAKWDPTALVGGHVPQWRGRNYRIGAAPWLVCESDESDGSFVHLAPQAVLLTNVEADHLDFHGSLDNLHAAFRAFLHRLVPEGTLVVCAEDPGARRLMASFRGPRITYGFADGAGGDATVRVGSFSAQGTAMTFALDGRSYELTSPLLGRHNALNLAGVFALGCALGAEPAALLRGLADFRGVARRQQRIGALVVPGGTLTVFDDYAHHPTEIAVTLAGFRAVHAGPITVVFQPHLYSRTAQFAAEFAEALRPAEHVYVTDVYGAREAPVVGVSGRMIVERLADHPSAHALPHWSEFVGQVRAGAVPAGLLLTLGAGDITGLGPLLLREQG